MKKIISLIILLIVVGCSDKTNNITGPIPVDTTANQNNSILKYSYYYQGQDSVLLQYSIYDYDLNYRKIKASFFNVYNQPIGYSLYTYNSFDSVATWIYCDSSGRKDTSIYTYDLNRNKVKVILKFWTMQEYDIHTYSYDLNNNLIEYKKYFAFDTVTALFATKIYYNSNNDIIKIEDYTRDSLRYFVLHEIIYDSMNNIIIDNGLKSDGSQYNWTYKYDINNRMIEGESDSYGSNYKITYEYDIYGNLIREEIYYDSILSSRIVYEYVSK